MAWRNLDDDSPSIEDWVVAYAARRYATNSTANGTSAANPHVAAAWKLLLDAVYGGGAQVRHVCVRVCVRASVARGHEGWYVLL